VVVKVERVKEHPIYRKKYSVTTNFKAHDEKNQYKVGDVIEIAETAPISRDKHWVAKRKVTSEELTS
jgi:small subunit ribosomal protein S17